MTAAQQPLTEAQRNQILDQAIMTRIGTGGYIGNVSSTGQVTLRRTGPIVWKRGTTWAEIWYNTPMTHWAKALLNTIWCLFTCGLYLPFWFGWSFKAPKTGVLSVDEYGNQAWTPNKISTNQKIMRWVVFAVMVWWLFTAIHYINQVNAPPRVAPLSPNGFGYGN